MFKFTSRQLGFHNIRDVEERISARANSAAIELSGPQVRDPNARYDHLIRTCVEHHEIWTTWVADGLISLNWGARGAGLADLYCAPVFPSAELGRQYFGSESDGDEYDCVPVPIDDFIDEIAPELDANKTLVCGFPVRHPPGTIVVSVGDFILDMRLGWEEFYDGEMLLDASIADEFLDFARKSWLRRQMHGKPAGQLP